MEYFKYLNTRLMRSVGLIGACTLSFWCFSVFTFNITQKFAQKKAQLKQLSKQVKTKVKSIGQSKEQKFFHGLESDLEKDIHIYIKLLSELFEKLKEINNTDSSILNNVGSPIYRALLSIGNKKQFEKQAKELGELLQNNMDQDALKTLERFNERFAALTPLISEPMDAVVFDDSINQIDQMGGSIIATLEELRTSFGQNVLLAQSVQEQLKEWTGEIFDLLTNVASEREQFRDNIFKIARAVKLVDEIELPLFSSFRKKSRDDFIKEIEAQDYRVAIVSQEAIIAPRWDLFYKLIQINESAKRVLYKLDPKAVRNAALDKFQQDSVRFINNSQKIKLWFADNQFLKSVQEFTTLARRRYGDQVFTQHLRSSQGWDPVADKSDVHVIQNLKETFERDFKAAGDPKPLLESVQERRVLFDKIIQNMQSLPPFIPENKRLGIRGMDKIINFFEKEASAAMATIRELTMQVLYMSPEQAFFKDFENNLRLKIANFKQIYQALLEKQVSVQSMSEDFERALMIYSELEYPAYKKTPVGGVTKLVQRKFSKEKYNITQIPEEEKIKVYEYLRVYEINIENIAFQLFKVLAVMEDMLNEVLQRKDGGA